jgi:hypothetical protein
LQQQPQQSGKLVRGAVQRPHGRIEFLGEMITIKLGEPAGAQQCGLLLKR